MILNKVCHVGLSGVVAKLSAMEWRVLGSHLGTGSNLEQVSNA